MFVFNGQLLTADKALDVDFRNRSFKYGDGLFETIRVYRGKAIFTDRHFGRLRKGMVLLGYSVSWDSFEGELMRSIDMLLDHQELAGPGKLRLHVWREGQGAYAPKNDQASYLIEYSTLPSEYFEQPDTATLSDFHGVRLHHHALSGLKTASALPYVLAARQARDARTDDVIMYHQDGYVAEASSSNIFLLNKQRISTPALSSGCLEGTMRGLMIDLCQSLPFEIEETTITQKQVQKAEAVFLTNAVRGIRVVRQYGSVVWKEEAWKKLVFLQKSLVSMANRELI